MKNIIIISSFILLCNCKSKLIENKNICYNDFKLDTNEMPQKGNYLLFFSGYSSYSNKKSKELASSFLASETIKKSFLKKKIDVYLLYIDEKEKCGEDTKGKINTDALLKLTNSNSIPTYIAISNGRIIDLQKGEFNISKFETSWENEVQ